MTTPTGSPWLRKEPQVRTRADSWAAEAPTWPGPEPARQSPPSARADLRIRCGLRRSVMGRRPQIPVLLARAALAAERPAEAVGGPPLKNLGVTYSMAQEVRWVDADTFTIGRWDGTLTLFGPPAAAGAGPRIESAAVSPAWAGLEMITPLAPGRFATSNDERSIALWTLSASGRLSSPTALAYDLEAGVANSGAVVGDEPLLVTGHAHGRLVVWVPDRDGGGLRPARMIDIR